MDTSFGHGATTSARPDTRDPGHVWARAMQSGAFPEAWRISDAILARRDPASRDDPSLPYHKRWVWSGSRPDGQDVLVRCYHGLGDTLQFARFLPELRARAKHLTVEAQPELCPLLACLPCIDRLAAFDPAHPLPPSACDVEIMELAHVLRVDKATIQANTPYLHVPEQRLARGRNRASGHIALCWEAGGWDTSRSMPLPSLLNALAADPEIARSRYISLQRGAAASQAHAEHFANPNDMDTDILETAALICAADRTVTVDTMVAHLAGALGCPATILLKPDPDWRWPTAGSETIWYPSLKVVHGCIG